MTFTGLDLLALATVNGSINLTSDVSFQSLSELVMYARGAGSNLTLNSPISNIGTLELAAEGSIQLANPGAMSVGDFHARAGNDLMLQLGGSLLVNGSVRLDTLVLPGTTVASGANVTLNVTGDYTNSSTTESSRMRVRNEGAHIGTGGNIAVSIGGDLTTSGSGEGAGDFSLVVQNTSGLIDNGGNITLRADGSVSTQGQLNLLVENYNETDNPAGHIGTGGNISLATGGNLTADSMSVAINNRGGGIIDSGASVILNIGGALTTLHDGPDFIGNTESLSLAISSRYDNDTPGSFIGGDATLLFHSDSASIGGFLAVLISDRGGTIDGNALLNFNVTHDLTVQEDANWEILNDSGIDTNAASPIGGTTHGSANLALSATNLTVTAGSLFVDILNKNGGVVGSGGTINADANITFTLSGNLTTHGNASFAILNQLQSGGTGGTAGTTGGTIGGNATINVSAADLTADSLLVNINNRNDGVVGSGGAIDSNATINFNIAGNLITQTGATFSILNSLLAGGTTGGTIGADATINVTAASISPGVDSFGSSLHARIGNNGGGSIGGNAIINFGASDVNAQGNATFEIDNSNGGTIGGIANVAVNVTNDVTAPGVVTLQILNGNSGHIVTGADILYSVGGTTSIEGLNEYIDNTNGGAIDNGGNITLHTVGPVMLDGGFSLEVDNFNGGTINNGANVAAHFVGDVTATIGSGHSFNWYVLNGSGFFNPTATGGTIGTGGNLDITFDGNASTTGTSTTGSISAEIQNGSGGSIGTGGNISMIVGGNLNSGPLFLITDNEGGHIGTGGNNTLNVSGDITTQGDAQFQIFNNDNGNGSGPGALDSDATINVTAANISSGGSLFDNIFNYSGGSIGGNAAINLSVGGNLTTAQGGTLDLSIINNDGGHIGGDAGIFFSVGGSVNTTDLNVGIQDYNGGTILGGGDVTLTIKGSLTVAENTHPLFLFVNTFGGGSINNGGNIFASVDGDLSTGNISSGIQNQDGGTINTGGNFSLNVGGNLTTAQNADAAFFINNFNGGFIGNSGSISVSTGGNISAGRALGFTISNETNGIISSDAMMNVAANNISVVDSVNTFLVNQQGSIGGSAAINFLAPAGIDAGNGAFFAIVNEDNGGTTPGGTIAGDALVHITSGHFSTEALVASDFNLFGTIHNSGGSIAGNANVMFDISGAITTEGTASFDTLNFDDGGPNGGGIIGGDARVSINAGALSIGGDLLLVKIINEGGAIGGNAVINADVSGAISTQGEADFQIFNENNGSGGGSIGLDATINVSAANISTGGSLFAEIFNANGGSMGFSGGTIGGARRST